MNVRDIVQRHIANIATPFDRQDRSIYAERMVSEFPNAPEGHTNRLEGAEALGKFLARIGEFAPERRVENVEVFETAGGAVAVFQSNFTVKDNGRFCSMPMILILDIAEGKITRFREYYDPLKVLKAFGELD